MKLVDANVLIYAVNSDSVHHSASRTWLESALDGGTRVGFAWNTLLAFVRLSTHPSILSAPIPVPEALALVDDWLGQPATEVLHPSARHAHVLNDLLAHVGTGGNLVNDAHLAALSIEHRAEIVSYDTDFDRFPAVRWSRPGP